MDSQGSPGLSTLKGVIDHCNTFGFYSEMNRGAVREP